MGINAARKLRAVVNIKRNINSVTLQKSRKRFPLDNLVHMLLCSLQCYQRSQHNHTANVQICDRNGHVSYGSYVSGNYVAI
jgi:hypothetical protein